MAELITIDKDALIRAIYSSTDASEVDARTIVNSVTAPPPAGAQQAVADALNAYGDICFARGAGEWPNDPNRAVPDHKDHDRAFAAVLALTASAAAQRADCARCKGVGAVGDHNGERAVEISCDHCGGTGRAPSATPAPEAAPSAKEGEALRLLFLEAIDWGRSYGQRLSLSDVTLQDVAQGYADKAVAALAVPSLKGLTPAGGDHG